MVLGEFLLVAWVFQELRAFIEESVILVVKLRPVVNGI